MAAGKNDLMVFKLQRPVGVDGAELQIQEQGPILCYNKENSLAFMVEPTAEVLKFFEQSDRKVKTFAYGRIAVVAPDGAGAVEWAGLAPWQDW